MDGPDVSDTATRSEVLTFTTGNWNEPRTVTVTGSSDDVDNPGGGRALVVTHIVASTDPAFNNADAASVTVTVVDDDPTLVTLSGGGAVAEAAGATEGDGHTGPCSGRL